MCKNYFHWLKEKILRIFLSTYLWERLASKIKTQKNATCVKVAMS